ncbi:MAG TPA: hypothetical protein VFC46_10680, partial [Humisphaera sp.]|nr:hypothetical protein [Humisphaera sp.]
MNIPKYWARSDNPAPGSFSCWQSSNVSLEDAQRDANARALELARKFQAGASLDRYSYGDRPLREEVVQTLTDNNGNDVAVVTRNLYGALILNASSAMFIDVDFASHGQIAPTGGFFRRLFFGKESPDDAEQRCLKQIRAWAARQPGVGLKIYRTCAGLRCLVTNQTFDPTRPHTIELLRDIGSDPLYVRLCQSQACFRARLTPKPWRCGTPLPPARFPLNSAAAESSFNQWRTEYE